MTYDVFFSYRHKPLDGEITSRVFQWIESYRLPSTLRNQGYKEIERAFRDTEELPVSRILTDTIDNALNSARVLIVVCSSDTPASEWVDREVEMFIELGRAEHIYPLLISGDEETSFPPSLRKVPGIQDRVMDVRSPGNDVKDIMKKVPDQLLTAVSAITGCPEPVLRREDGFRRNRTIRRGALIAAGVLLFTAVVSFSLMRLARNYRNEALRQEQAAMRILSELTYGLPDHLTNVPGAYSRIAGILEDNTRTIDEIMRLSGESDETVYESAANREKLANARSVLGMYDEALAAEEEAIRFFEELARSKKDSFVQAYGSSYNNKGSILHAAGRYPEAGEAYRNAVAILKGIKTVDAPLLARVYGNLAANAVSAGDPSAGTYFDEALAILEKNEDDPEAVLAAAGILYNRGVGLYRLGSYGEAAEYLRESAKKYETLMAAAETLQNKRAYLNSLAMLAACLTDAGDYGEAEEYYTGAEKEAEKLAEDRENLDDQILLAELYNNHGLCLNIQGKYDAADGLYRNASQIYQQISGKAMNASSRARYALSVLNRGENSFKAGRYGDAAELFEEGLKIYEADLPDLSDYDKAQYYTWLSYHNLINLRNFEGAYDAAFTACSLQPDNVLANMNLGYACLYCGYDEDCLTILKTVASLGEGQAETIRKDLKAQEAAGMNADLTAKVIQMLDEVSAAR